MGLQLHPVAAGQGWRWIRQGSLLWWSRPLAFIGLMMLFLATVVMLALVVPVLGGLMGLALLPMLTLGFMLASRSALAKGPVHGLQLIQGLRDADRQRRRAQWLLCATYAAGSMLVITLSEWVDGGLLGQLQQLAADEQSARTKAAIEAILADPRLVNGMVVRLVLASLVSVPFWHAPALVHWGGQGALQALFSSSVALWRARGAFTVYFLAWGGLTAVAALLVVLLAAFSGSRELLVILSMMLSLVLSAVFYTSLWFSFADSFGVDSAADGADTPLTIGR